jgi:hypothetical protein
MASTEYVVGRVTETQQTTMTSSGEQTVGPAHAVLTEVAERDGPYRAECGERVDVIRGGSWPPHGPGAAAPCPICARLTGA